MKTPYKKQLAYSLFLTLAIPGLLIGTVVWNLRGFAKLTDQGLQRQAVLLADAFAPTAINNLQDPAALTASMQLLQSRQPLIREITTYKHTGDSFVVVASTDQSKSLLILSQVSSTLAWTEKKSVATVALIGPLKERVWSVVSPLYDSNGTAVALLETKISTQDIDALIQDNYLHTGLILSAEIILILLLLVNYFKFASYARLLNASQEVERIRQGLLNAVSMGLELPALTLRNYATMFSKYYGNSLDTRAKEFLDAMLEHATKLVTVVIGLSEYSKIQQGSTPISPYPLHLEELCDKVCDELLSNSPQEGVTLLSYQRPDAPVVVLADGSILRQILFNILGLLLRYANYGNVIVRFEPYQNNRIRLILDPVNLLMTPEVQDSFFKPHLQATETMTNKFADLGIIYLLSTQLIQQMGAEMGVHFEDNGKTTFWFLLPLSEQTIQDTVRKNFL